MKKKKSFWSRFYVVLCLAFFYLPILVTMIFSFNSSKSLTKFSGFSLRWYAELLNNVEVVKAVYVSVSIAIIATIISTVLGTITAIGLSRSRKVLRDLILNINNIPILNPEIVTAIGLMLLFSSIGMRKGYVTMLIAHISFCTPYVITSVYPKVRSLDPNLANAAMDLGATPFEALTKVIVPMINPTDDLKLSRPLDLGRIVYFRTEAGDWYRLSVQDDDVFDSVMDAGWQSLNQFSNGDMLNRFHGDISTVSDGQQAVYNSLS